MKPRETPDFRSRDFLIGHIESIMAFYDPVCQDPVSYTHLTLPTTPYV